MKSRLIRHNPRDYIQFIISWRKNIVESRLTGGGRNRAQQNGFLVNFLLKAIKKKSKLSNNFNFLVALFYLPSLFFSVFSNLAHIKPSAFTTGCGAQGGMINTTYLITSLVFLVRTVSYGTSFF